MKYGHRYCLGIAFIIKKLWMVFLLPMYFEWGRAYLIQMQIDADTMNQGLLCVVF